MARVWFVTGCSRGLGRAVAEAVLKSGDSLVATARKSQPLNDLVEQYGSDRVLLTDLDVADNDQVIQAVNQAVTKFGRIDILVNNAGICEGEAIEYLETDALKKHMDINFYGVVNMSKAVIPIMRKQQSGHIMQVTTIGLRNALPGLGAYQSAKWAVAGYSSVLALELAPFNIKVTVMEPGGMKTDMADGFKHPEVVHESYRQLVGAYFKGVLDGADLWSEVVDIADAIIRVSKLDEPPARLLLGADSVKYGKAATEGLLASDEKWKDLSMLSSPAA